MADQPLPLRVLQLIGDTEATTTHLGALTLHRELDDVGVEVRTLALAPGRVGGLDDVVPVMAPARRSWTIRRVLDREARWADVCLVHAPDALVRQTRRRPGRPPVVAVLAVDGGGCNEAPVIPEGVDEFVVVVSPGTGAGATAGPDTPVTGELRTAGLGGRGVTHLRAPVEAVRWRELLTDCAVRAR